MRKIIFLAVLGATLTGCYKNELESANAENNKLSSEIENLKSEITKLTAENTKLKETAEYFYQQGKDNLEASKFAEAISAFNTVVDRFPADPLVPLAKKSWIIATKAQAKEAKKKEALQAQCKDILKTFTGNLTFSATYGAENGYIQETFKSGNVSSYKKCVAACSGKGIDCLSEGKTALLNMYVILRMSYPPDQVQRFKSFGEQALGDL